jgi:hypothetical protein
MAGADLFPAIPLEDSGRPGLEREQISDSKRVDATPPARRKMRAVRNEGGVGSRLNLPDDLQGLQAQISCNGIYRLMGLATAKGQRLSDVVQVLGLTSVLEKRNPYSYLTTVLKADRDWRHLADKTRQQQATAEVEQSVKSSGLSTGEAKAIAAQLPNGSTQEEIAALVAKTKKEQERTRDFLIAIEAHAEWQLQGGKYRIKRIGSQLLQACTQMLAKLGDRAWGVVLNPAPLAALWEQGGVQPHKAP